MATIRRLGGPAGLKVDLSFTPQELESVVKQGRVEFAVGDSLHVDGRGESVDDPESTWIEKVIVTLDVSAENG